MNIEIIFKDRLKIKRIETWKGHSFIGEGLACNYFIKVFPKTEYSMEFVQRQVGISEHLIKKGILTPKHVPVDLQSGVLVGEADSFYYFVQEYIENDAVINFREFGKAMRRVDDALADYQGNLKPYLPLTQYAEEIRGLVGSCDLETLSKIKKKHAQCLSEFYLIGESSSVIHGDFHSKNVIISKGRYYVIDFEQVGLNIPDFSTLNIDGETRLFNTISEDNYLEFCNGIGYNIRENQNYTIYKNLYDLSVMIAYAQKGENIDWITE